MEKVDFKQPLMRVRNGLFVQLLTILAVPMDVAVAQQAFFLGLGSELTPAGVSHDGQLVYGAGEGGVVRWTKDGGLLPIGVSASPLGVSGDGSTVVGAIGTPQQQAFRWTASTGLLTVGGNHFQGVSYDGMVAVGLGPAGASLWTPSNGFVAIDLSAIPGEAALANATSSDSSVVVGRIGLGERSPRPTQPVPAVQRAAS